MNTNKSENKIGKTNAVITSFLLVWICLLITAIPTFAIPDSFSSIVKNEKMKVVHIATTSVIKRPPEMDPYFERFFPNVPKERKSNALGSGFFISDDGYILTNNHVVEGADKIQVFTIDEKKYDAKLIGADPKTDLALIKIEGDNFPASTLGNSSDMEIGDWVIAIGNPLGLDFTVTVGIVSAIERSLMNTAYGQFIQTDAAINFGNSGGPLLNTKGEVIGINTAIASSGQGLSFAVPIDVAKNIIQQLKSKGRVERGWLGVGIQDLTYEMKSGLSVPEDLQGVVINQVGEDTPAEKGGLKEGDVIVEVNGQKTEKTGALQQLIAETAPNNTATIKLYRDGKQKTLKVKVGLAAANMEANSPNGANNSLGFNIRYMPSAEAKENGYPYPGVVVTSVDPNSEAAQNGIQTGDLIRQVDRQNFNSIEEFNKLVVRSKGKTVLLLVYKPDRGNIYITIQK